MKRIARFVLALTLLLSLAQPTFACVTCLFDGTCGWGGGPRCKPAQPAGCESGTPCGGGGFSVVSLSSEYRIASVEITHGSDAKVQVAEKKTAQPKTARVEARR